MGKSTTAIIAQEKGKINMDVFDRSEPWLEAEKRAAKDDEWQQTLPICERCGRRIFDTEYVHIELRKHILDLCLECVDDMTIINEAAEVAE